MSCAAHRSVVEPEGGEGSHISTVVHCVAPEDCEGRHGRAAYAHCMEPNVGDHCVVPGGGEGNHISTVMHCVEPGDGEGCHVRAAYFHCMELGVGDHCVVPEGGEGGATPKMLCIF